MLRRRNLSPIDFGLRWGPTSIVATSGRVGEARNALFVLSRRTGIERSYTRGGMSIGNSPLIPWVIEVARDLDDGGFAA